MKGALDGSTRGCPDTDMAYTTSQQRLTLRERTYSQQALDGSAHVFRARTGIERNDYDPVITRAVARAQAGDMDAIHVLYLRYKNHVYGYVLSILRDEHEAEDVTQHAFMKLIRVIHQYEAREVPFTSWILRVARNVAVDHLRQRRPIPTEEVIETTRAADEAAHDCRWGLEQALEELPEDQRDVVMLRHLVGLSPGEIASRMNRTEASIHGLHHRARLALRRELTRVECAPRVRATTAA
jgi:RNA polymerase sigma-70 factor (ECF subfamily)